MRSLRWVLALSMIVALAVLGGCVVVKPWQRGRLARPVMAEQGDAAEEICAHTLYNAREGAGGGGGGGLGAGCACN